MTLSTSCSTVIVSEQFRHSMMTISIICDMTTSSSFSIQQQYDMSQLWKYDTLPDTDTNVSLCAVLYICEGRPPISACFVVTSISRSQREYHSKSRSQCSCVCMRVSVSDAHKEGQRTHTQAVDCTSCFSALSHRRITKQSDIKV